MDSIYEIYRACRLCGAGAGYKMPIIQNVIVTDGEDVELKQKIRECVQIEVHQGDKMPPLICELCVDKVNDFYEFLVMCRQTNIKTRKRLGLPMQTTQKGASEDCILGVTEPVYVNEDSNEPLFRSSPRNAKQILPKLKKVEVKLENIKSGNIKGGRINVGSIKGGTVKVGSNKSDIIKGGRFKVGSNKNESSKGGSIKGGEFKGGKPAKKRERTPSPIPRVTRLSRSSNEDNVSLSSLKHQTKRSPRALPPPPPKSILKRETKIEDKPEPRPKRTQEPPKPVVPEKKVKLSVQPVQPVPRPPPMVKCTICRNLSKTSQANGNHMRSHTVTFTSSKLACNSCREWFSSPEDASSHHRRHQVRHRPYQCRGCNHKYETYTSYQAHVSKGDCVPWVEVPDVKCADCWRHFPTNNLRDEHKCPGADGRPGGKCANCYRTYALLKNLKKHESTCNPRRKRESYIDPELLSKLRDMQILVSRCDPLLQRVSNGHYDVSDVEDYGLDLTRDYPYLYSASLNFDRMVNIKTGLDFYYEQDYIHWDSELSDDEDEEKETERKVLPLSTLVLKTLFSQKCLGRVPRKKRKVKPEKSIFDTLINTDADFDMSFDIGNIIDNLENDDNSDGGDFKDEQESVEKVVNKNKKDTLNKSNKSEETRDKYRSKESEKSSNETKKSKETSDKNENIKRSDEKATKINNDSTNTDAAEGKSGENKSLVTQKANIESNEKGTEQDNRASDLSMKTDSVSESIADKNKDTNVSENRAKIDSNNKDIKETDDTVKTDAVKEDVDYREVSKSSKTEQNVKKLGLPNKHKNNEENTKDDIENTEKSNVSTEHLDNVSYSEQKSKTNDNVKTPDIANSSEVKDSKSIEKDVKCETNTQNHKTQSGTDEITTNDNITTNGVDEKSDKLNMDEFNDVCDSEIDDKKLMDDLNEQLGESDKISDSNKEEIEKNDNTYDAKKENTEKINVCGDPCDGKRDDRNMNVKNDGKISLDDLMAVKDSDARSMDLDSISDDEFNFDS